MSSSETTALVSAKDLVAGYLPGINILNGCNLYANKGELVGIIGPNGAGKSTLLKALFGLVKIREGNVILAGEEITNMRADQLVERGIGFVPQSNNVFPSLTIEENLQMGAYVREDDEVQADIAKVFAIFPRLKERALQLAGTMSGGEQQMLAMARALMSRPRLLLLDEPSMGLAPIMVERIFEVVREVAQQGVTILLVEQNVRQALAIATRGYVMESGRIVLHDTAANLLQDARVVEAYLGG